ncbi:MAG TPA: ATP-binding protein [Gemmataceae bacterium]|jgi:heavy metal sensor kinase
MTLTARLSLFFLVALAVVLIGFSMTLYLLARTYLHRQIENRLEAALDVLSATAEIKSDGVEWEADERPVTLAALPGEESVAWQVRDDRGRMIDGRRSDAFAGDASAWRVRSRRLPTEVREARSAKEDNKDNKYHFIVLTTGLPLRPVNAILRNLLLLLDGLSMLLWLSAALLGRQLCRRALAPVARMATAARVLSATEPGWRLPVAATGDELQDLGRAFNDLLSRLHESFQRQARFTGDASHQLRTPLTALLGQIEIALRRPRAAEEYQQTLTVLQRQALQLRQIVDSLLFLARADAEAKLPQLERLEMRVWLTEHLASWSGHARAADVCRQTSADGLVWVMAQAPLLRQLLDNLLDNACKYSAAGTPITVNLAQESGIVSLTVTDAGRGIADEDLPHIFEPFYRAEQMRRQGVSGLGLGLAVAQRIALALGGTLGVESQPGHGARFTLQMPSVGG